MNTVNNINFPVRRHLVPRVWSSLCKCDPVILTWIYVLGTRERETGTKLSPCSWLRCAVIVIASSVLSFATCGLRDVYADPIMAVGNDIPLGVISPSIRSQTELKQWPRSGHCRCVLANDKHHLSKSMLHPSRLFCGAKTHGYTPSVPLGLDENSHVAIFYLVSLIRHGRSEEVHVETGFATQEIHWSAWCTESRETFTAIDSD